MITIDHTRNVNVPVEYGDSLNLDAFGRLRVSQLETQYYSKQLYDKLPLFVDEVLNGTATATHSVVNAETELATTNSGDYAILQTKTRSNYQSGKSQQILMTLDNFQPETNIIKRIGYFHGSTVAPYDTDYDGIFLESDGTTIRLKVYRTGTEVHNIPQSDWNDSLDGTGASRVILDWSKTQIFGIDFQWLGVGRLRFTVSIDGVSVLFHEIDNANSLDKVYMSSPNQPLRWEIRQNGAGSGTFYLICTSSNSEGSDNRTGKIQSGNTGTNTINAQNPSNKYAVLGIRLKTTHFSALIDVLDFSILATTQDNQLVEVWLNPTVSGTFTYNDVPESALQLATGATTNTITGGILLFSKYISFQNATSFTFENALKIGSTIDGIADELVITANPLSNNSQVLGSMNWRELI